MTGPKDHEEDPAPAGPEAKVIAGAGGATAGGVLAALLLWALDTYVFTGGRSGDTVPPIVTAAAVLFLGGAGSWIAAWLAPHTPRRDPAVAAAARDALTALDEVNARMDELETGPRPIRDVHLPDLPTGPAPGAPPVERVERNRDGSLTIADATGADALTEEYPPPVEPGNSLR